MLWKFKMGKRGRRRQKRGKIRGGGGVSRSACRWAVGKRRTGEELERNAVLCFFQLILVLVGVWCMSKRMRPREKFGRLREAGKGGYYILLVPLGVD
jgi:hypothetical protein